MRLTYVLLADDDRVVRYITALLFGDLGYQVSRAASAEGASGEVEHDLASDLLVIDHLVAGKTGMQFVKKPRQRFLQLPVLVVTGYTNLIPKQFNDFEVLIKPLRHNEPVERLARLSEVSSWGPGPAEHLSAHARGSPPSGSGLPACLAVPSGRRHGGPDGSHAPRAGLVR